jgi:hypothetical protein
MEVNARPGPSFVDQPDRVEHGSSSSYLLSRHIFCWLSEAHAGATAVLVSMNSTPAASKAWRIAKSFAAVRDGLSFDHPRHAVQI